MTQIPIYIKLCRSLRVMIVRGPWPCNPNPWSMTIFMLWRAWETVSVFIFYICVSMFQLSVINSCEQNLINFIAILINILNTLFYSIAHLSKQNKRGNLTLKITTNQIRAKLKVLNTWPMNDRVKYILIRNQRPFFPFHKSHEGKVRYIWLHKDASTPRWYKKMCMCILS